VADSDFEISIWPEQPKGGQHVGSGPRGVKIVHIPTGMTAMCDTERSQHRNRSVAMHMIEGGLTSPFFQGYRE
jgi:peptide chain release factor 2